MSGWNNFAILNKFNRKLYSIKKKLSKIIIENILTSELLERLTRPFSSETFKNDFLINLLFHYVAELNDLDA